MKDLANKAFKFIAASIGILVSAWVMGWSGAIALHSMFKTERVEAQNFVNSKIVETETKWNAIRRADLDGIHGQLNILVEQNKLIISQNYRTRKMIEATQ
jgi:hypothetical protein